MAEHEHRETSPNVLAPLAETWIGVPAWAEKPQPLALKDVEIASIVALLRDPPTPTAALQRALTGVRCNAS